MFPAMDTPELGMFLKSYNFLNFYFPSLLVSRQRPVVASQAHLKGFWFVQNVTVRHFHINELVLGSPLTGTSLVLLFMVKGLTFACAGKGFTTGIILSITFSAHTAQHIVFLQCYVRI